MTKLLPLDLHPPIKGGLHFAYPLSILGTRKEHTPWLHNHFTQLFCHADFPHHDFFSIYFHTAYPFLICPLLDVQWLDRKLVSDTPEDLIRFIVGCIDRDYYVQLFADEFFIPDRGAYKKHHFVHDTLISGYDNSTEELQIVGYNSRGQYTTSCVGFSAMAQALAAVDQLPPEEQHFRFRQLWLARYLEEETCHFDRTLVSEQLRDFLTSRNSSERLRMINSPEEVGSYRERVPLTYGLETYRCLGRYLDLLGRGECRFDPRPFHWFWEHKQCMLARLEYMEQHRFVDSEQPISPRYQIILEDARIVRMMLLKYGMRPDRALLNRARHRLDRCIRLEIPLLEEVLEKIDPNRHTSDLDIKYLPLTT
ncbi:MAG: hypothetical protein HOC74_28840 [Gemmatimonadetes bacterium]|nr:hypothetical protein [Gemmatimonadota bacterium]